MKTVLLAAAITMLAVITAFGSAVLLSLVAGLGTFYAFRDNTIWGYVTVGAAVVFVQTLRFLHKRNRRITNVKLTFGAEPGVKVSYHDD